MASQEIEEAARGCVRVPQSILDNNTRILVKVDGISITVWSVIRSSETDGSGAFLGMFSDEYDAKTFRFRLMWLGEVCGEPDNDLRIYRQEMSMPFPQD